MIKKLSKKIYNILNSKKFFYFVIATLVIQAAWFALTVQYPMAFDENYHFGIIQIFSHQLSPFITNVPPSSAVYGEITRFDSYLYHYLMSFPYRLITIFVHDQIPQIIILRFMNIGIFVGGMMLFRNLFKRLNISNGLINFSLLMLVLIPIVPFLAATISYDNLIFLLVPLITILTLNCRDEIVKHKKIPATSFIFLLVVGMLSSLVKYPFLPIFAATIIYLLIIFIKTSSKTKLLKTIISSFNSSKRWLKIILIISLVISGGLFAERYGVNLVQYHSLEPDCGKIQSVDYCIQFGPWGRNYSIANTVAATNPNFDPPISSFVPYWFGYMAYRLYFAINYDYYSDLPLPTPIAVAAIISIIGLMLGILYRRVIFKDRRLWLLVTIILLYVGAIFYTNLVSYLQYRTMLAINGRYLIMIIPLLFVFIGLAYRNFITDIFKTHAKLAKVILSVTVVILLLQGGGALTHLIRSQPNWYWQNKIVLDFNTNLKKIISPLIIGS